MLSEADCNTTKKQESDTKICNDSVSTRVHLFSIPKAKHNFPQHVYQRRKVGEESINQSICMCTDTQGIHNTLLITNKYM